MQKLLFTTKADFLLFNLQGKGTTDITIRGSACLACIDPWARSSDSIN